MKQGVWVAILVVVIIIAVVIAVASTTGRSRSEGRTAAETAMIAVIDVQSGEKVQVKAKDWTGYKVDPDTSYRIGEGGRRLSEVFRCVSCGQEIPAPPIPIEERRDKGEGWYRRSYRCPKCKGPATDEAVEAAREGALPSAP